MFPAFNEIHFIHHLVLLWNHNLKPIRIESLLLPLQILFQFAATRSLAQSLDIRQIMLLYLLSPKIQSRPREPVRSFLSSRKYLFV